LGNSYLYLRRPHAAGCAVIGEAGTISHFTGNDFPGLEENRPVSSFVTANPLMHNCLRRCLSWQDTGVVKPLSWSISIAAAALVLAGSGCAGVTRLIRVSNMFGAVQNCNLE
jgi:hypothetical protein